MLRVSLLMFLFFGCPVVDHGEFSAYVAPNLFDFAEHTALRKAYRLAERLFAALLRARLEHDPACVDRIHNLLPLFDRESQGLFAVDVLARARREHRNNRVPVVGRYDEHRVDRFVGEEISEVLVGFDRYRFAPALVVAFDSVFVVCNAFVLDIADCGDAYGLVGEKSADVPAHHLAETDKPHIDFVVRRPRRKESVRKEERRGGGNADVFQKTASFHMVVNFVCCRERGRT